MISAENKYLLNRMNSTAFKTQMGNVINRKLGVVRGSWKFSVQGGAVGTFNFLEDLLDPTSKILLPSKAIVTKAYIDIITAMASAGNAGTIAVQIQMADDLLAAVDADTLSGIVAGVPTGAAAAMIKLTAERTLQGVIAVEALTAGQFDVYVEYVLGQ